MNADFYEDDEPVESVVAAFATGEKGQTGQVINGHTLYLPMSGLEPAGQNEPNGLVRT